VGLGTYLTYGSVLPAEVAPLRIADAPPVRPARQRRCRICNALDHLAAACPHARQLADERRPRLRQLAGLAGAQAIRLMEPEHVNPNAGDDPRVGLPVVPARDPDEVKAEKVEAIYENLRNKAVGMWLTKDFESIADRRVIMQSLVQLSRKEKLYTLSDAPDAHVQLAFDAALRIAYDTRLRSAKSNTKSRGYAKGGLYSVYDSFARGFQGEANSEVNHGFTADLEELAFYERLPFFSRTVVLFWPWCLGIFIRLIISVMSEKWMFMAFAIVVAPFVDLEQCGDISRFDDEWENNVARDPWTSEFEKMIERMTENRECYGLSECRDAWTPIRNYNLCYNLVVNYYGNLAIFIAFLLLVTFETVVVYGRYRTFAERFTDFCLRCVFHSIDALIASSAFFTTVGVFWGRIICYSFIAFHTLFNAFYLIIKGEPHRCMSIVECCRIVYDVCLEDHDLKVFPTQNDYQVHPGELQCKPKVGVVQFWGIAGVLPTVFSNCSHNEKISMDGRVGKKLPSHVNFTKQRGVVGAWRRLLKVVAPMLESLPKCNQPMDFYEWACTFPPSRRDELLRTRIDMHDMPPLHAKSFIKREIALKDEEDPVYKDPRFIQGCPLELSAAVGPSLRVWTKQVRQRLTPKNFCAAEISNGQQIIYTCGLSNEAIGECFNRAIAAVEEAAPAGSDIVFLEDDQSRFDLHLTEGPFMYLNWVYRRKMTRRVAGLLRRGVSRGTSSLGTAYRIPYTMQSGWPDTSVGDTLVNAGMKTFIHGAGRPWMSIICGDDSVTITTRAEINRLGGVDGIVKLYDSFGMEVEAVLRDDPLDVEFCSGRFYPTGQTYCLFPRPFRILAKIACDMKARRPDDQQAWLRGITATLENYGKIDPLLGALGTAFRKYVGKGRELYDHGWEYKAQFDGSLLTSAHDVFTYYDHHYGLSAGDVARYTDKLSKAQIGSLLCDDGLRELCLRDA